MIVMSAGAAFAAGPELNSFGAADVANAMEKGSIAMPDAPSKVSAKFKIITAVPGQSVTVSLSENLMWVTDPAAAGMGEAMSWSAADSACRNLSFGGYSDWELPSDQELLGLTDGHFKYPSIDQEFFKNTQLGYYWTATDYPGNSFLRRVWTVSFKGGGLYYATVMANRYYARCVRRGATYYQAN